MKDFKKKETWSRRDETGKGFAVEIVHWISGNEPDCHRWNVYGRLTEKHPLFSKIDTSKACYVQDDVFDTIPLPDINYLEVQKFDDFPVIVFGNDYNHLRNEGREPLGSKIEDVPLVVGDANRLFGYLNNCGDSNE